MTKVQVELNGISKLYGATVAVSDVSFQVPKGELLALLGPSGCGKTTTLRMVAGFVRPSSGTLTIAERDVTRVPPHKRDTGMVFQAYALFPHLSVFDNIAFGLRRRGIARAEVRERVGRMLDMLRLDGLQDRLPAQLSGGQQQRVAVGRALVINPAVLLLDEPFSNLDALVRDSTRLEMRRIQQELGLTVIFVTHDQSEAMAIADRVAVMDRGRLVQIGTPHEVYDRPNSRFVASFIGRANVIEVDGSHGGGEVVRTKAGFDVRFDASATQARDGIRAVVLRPEAISLDADAATGPNSVRTQVESVSFLGPAALFQLRLPGGTIISAEGPGRLAQTFGVGSEVTARWDASSLSGVPD